MIQKLVDQFVKSPLCKKHPSFKVTDGVNGKYLYIDNLLLMSRFIAFMNAKSKVLYLRGQTRDYHGMIPSLYRPVEGTKNNFISRHDAYEALIEGINTLTGLKRFNGKLGGAILQHYGIRTPWLDAVDNLFVALWFAAMEKINGQQQYRISEEPHGYIYLIESDKKKIDCVDLRRTVSHYTLRPHNQHGIFISKLGGSNSNFDLRENIVAIIQFPVSSLYEKINHLNDFFLPDFLMPNPNYDNTYRVLLKPNFKQLLRTIEGNFDLCLGELGSIEG